VHNYITLVKFLLEPLLQNPNALKVDCETNAKGDRLWLRVAFEPSEKGRIFGRNGRTIQAIRNLLATAGSQHNQVVCFDVFDPEPATDPHSAQSSAPRSALSFDSSVEITPKPDKPKPKLKLASSPNQNS
jgi:uncharacterized protein